MTIVTMVPAGGFYLLVAYSAFFASTHAACWFIVDHEKGNRYWAGKPIAKEVMRTFLRICCRHSQAPHNHSLTRS